jgi:hypothetical protein
LSGAQKIFISYSRDDRPFVKRLSGDLRRFGLDTWVDIENIKPGLRWDTELDRAIKESDALIFVLSQNMVASRWVLAELQHFASAGKKKIFPVVIEDIDSSHVPTAISDIQWADFRHSYDHGLRTLLGAFGVDPAAVPTETAPLPKSVSKGYAFISYTPEDDEFVTSLREFLRENRYAYWDYVESDRNYGAQFLLELESRIKEATITLSIVSPSWKQSRWAVREFLYSEQVRTPVFLLKAREVEATLAIADMTPIDFTSDKASGFSKLERELARKGL